MGHGNKPLSGSSSTPKSAQSSKVPHYSPSNPRAHMFRKIKLIWEIPAASPIIPPSLGKLGFKLFLLSS